MYNKLFRKNIEPACSYCNHSSDIGSGNVMCVKKGVVDSDFHCSKFSYDPFNRRPPEPRKLNIKAFDAEDFTL